MAILLLADHDNATLSDQTAKALTAASQIGGDVHVLVAGKGAQAAADAAAKLTGVSKVLLADSDDLANNLAEPLAALIVSLAGSYDTILSAATSTGKNVLPRVAALLDIVQISEITEVVSADTFKRPIYAGNAIQTVQSGEAKKVITVRTASFASAADGGFGLGRNHFGCRKPWSLDLCQGRAVLVGPSGTDLCQDHHFRRPLHSAPRTSSRKSFCRSPTSSVPPSAHRALPSMQVMPPTTGRLARPARSSPPSSTSRSASPARSSIWPA